MNLVKLDLTMSEAVHVHIALDLMTNIIEQRLELATSTDQPLVLKRYKHVIEQALKAKGATYSDGQWRWRKA